MIRLIEALGYRSLRDVKQTVERFDLLVGPNASGKSTFLDTVGLLGQLLKEGPTEALRRRSPNFQDLTWMRRGSKFELAVEAEVPTRLATQAVPNTIGDKGAYRRIRYELALGLGEGETISVLGETLWFKPESPATAADPGPTQREIFPEVRKPRESIAQPARSRSPFGWKKVVQKSEGGNDYFNAETSGWNAPFKFGPQRLALANLPEDESRFPVAVWFRRFLSTGIQSLVLSGERMRAPSAPGSPTEFQPDGSNLPWVIHRLHQASPERFGRWLAHVRTALPDIDTIDTVEREEDKHRYLRITYRTGLKVPSWTVSDGTLRLLALTLVAYLDLPDRIYLIEEPENGIHPHAIETVYQALSSTYDCQIFCATHSPTLLSLADPASVLCFARTPDGETDIIRGSEHPNLREWRKGIDLGTLFAAGILGVTSYPFDLVVLVADLDQQTTIRALLDHRAAALGIRQLRYELNKHPRRDPGVFLEAPALLQSLQRRYTHALAILDREGSGRDEDTAIAMEQDLEARLGRSGWADRAGVVVIDPEIEVWVWSPSPHVEEVLGWKDRPPGLREWLRREGHWPTSQPKPPRPKEALEAALRESRVRSAPANFAALARQVGLERCADPSFLRLRQRLLTWFGSPA